MATDRHGYRKSHSVRNTSAASKYYIRGCKADLVATTETWLSCDDDRLRYKLFPAHYNLSLWLCFHWVWWLKYLEIVIYVKNNGFSLVTLIYMWMYQTIVSQVNFCISWNKSVYKGEPHRYSWSHPDQKNIKCSFAWT